MDAWLIDVKGKKYTAPSLEVLTQWVRSGKIRREYPILNPNTGEWHPAGEVAELRTFFVPVEPSAEQQVVGHTVAARPSLEPIEPVKQTSPALVAEAVVSDPLSRLEQKFLFPATRFLAWIMIVLLSVTAALGVFFFNNLSDDSEVTYDQVKRAIATTSESKTAQEAVASTIPEKFKKYFQGENEDILTGWLAPLDDEQRDEFLDGLWAVIKAAEKEDPTRLIDAINAYHTLKTAVFVAELQNRTTVRLMQMATGAAILIVLGLAAIFALIIAVLSLERRNAHLRARLVGAT
ncbi:MAG: hypothetical protein WA208_18490 [Thermoanaerobaculia bacterium]